ncbi:G-protein coupled receptor 98 [Liparis tanakae]|uniref:G-protein coupled receptor 98 n=1 Tax=Liparis tanakae TaxID=230148 RepID=A0A4Z2IEQ6_9TELE|nr:G-protein coupled receptor 98 [Liparis tanakae]
MDEVMDIKEILGGQAEGRLSLREGQTFSSITVPISSRVFSSVGDGFTAELTDVRLGGPIIGSPPRLLHEASIATYISCQLREAPEPDLHQASQEQVVPTLDPMMHSSSEDKPAIRKGGDLSSRYFAFWSSCSSDSCSSSSWALATIKL